MRPEKKLLMRDLVGRLNRHSSFVVADYQGMSAHTAVSFRRELREADGEFAVVRKRLFLKALEGFDIHLKTSDLQGHIGVVFALKDPLNVLKKAFAFASSQAPSVRFLISRFEGEILPSEQTEALSKLPGKSEMRSELLALLIAPIAQFLGATNALLCSLPRCLEKRGESQAL